MSSEESLLQDIAAVESAERDLEERRQATLHLACGELGLVMPPLQQQQKKSAANVSSLVASGIDPAAEQGNARAYLVFDGASFLGAFLGKFEALNVMCTFDFSETAGLVVSLLDRSNVCQVRMRVPRDACCAFALRDGLPCSAIVSTKALKRCAAACEKFQTLTISVTGDGEHVHWRLRPASRGGGNGSVAGRDELFLLRCQEPMNGGGGEDDGGGAEQGIELDPSLVPPCLAVSLSSKEFGTCVDRAYKAQEGNLVAALQASARTGLSVLAETYSVTVQKELCEFEGAQQSAEDAAKTLRVSFSLVYMQLLAAFRDGADVVRVTLPLRKAKRPGGKRKRDCEDEGPGAAQYPAAEMPLQLSFFGRNAEQTDAGKCVRVDIVLLRRDNDNDDDEESEGKSV